MEQFIGLILVLVYLAIGGLFLVYECRNGLEISASGDSESKMPAIFFKAYAWLVSIMVWPYIFYKMYIQKRKWKGTFTPSIAIVYSLCAFVYMYEGNDIMLATCLMLSALFTAISRIERALDSLEKTIKEATPPEDLAEYSKVHIEYQDLDKA